MIPNKKTTSLLALLGLLISLNPEAIAEMQDDATLGSRAAQRHEVMQERFAKADVNGDGMIDIDEFRAPQDRQHDRFAESDTNADGALTLEEMQSSMSARMNERLARRFSRMDLNGDGQVTTDEMHQGMFNRMDRNEDGYLQPEELHRKRGGPDGRHHQGKPRH